MGFKTELVKALKQESATNNYVAADAKNYGAIVGSTLPKESSDSGILKAAVDAYTALQAMDEANRAKAKKAAESRLYDSWHKRFKALVSGTFESTSGFKSILKCFKET